MADLFHFSPHLFQGRIFMPIVGPTSLGRKHVHGRKSRSQGALPPNFARARYIAHDGLEPRSPAGDSSASALRASARGDVRAFAGSRLSSGMTAARRVARKALRVWRKPPKMAWEALRARYSAYTEPLPRHPQGALPPCFARARYAEGGSPLRHTGRDGSGHRSPAGGPSVSALRASARDGDGRRGRHANGGLTQGARGIRGAMPAAA